VLNPPPRNDNKLKSQLASGLFRLRLKPHGPILIATLCLFQACSSPAQKPANGTGGIQVTDFRGKTLHFSHLPERIVCLIESSLSGLYMLGAANQVVGISADIYQDSVRGWYSRLDSRIQTRQLSAPGNWDFVNLESVMALRPDLVIIWAQQTEAIANLEEHGIPVFGVFVRSLEDVYTEMEMLGRLTGSSRNAAELNRWTRQELARLTEKTILPGGTSPPGVYFMWAQGELETSGSPSIVDELIRLAACRNVAAAIPLEHASVHMENLFLWDPDLMLLWYNPRRTPTDVCANPQLAPLRAIQNRRVYQLPDAFLCDLWTLKFQYAVKTLAKWAHPEPFAEMNLEQEEQQMLGTLYPVGFGR